MSLNTALCEFCVQIIWPTRGLVARNFSLIKLLLLLLEVLELLFLDDISKFLPYQL